MKNTSYCLKCKKQTPNSNSEIVKSKNNRTCLKSKCIICGSKKSKLIKSHAGGSVLSKAFNYIPELHLSTDGNGENVENGEFNNTGKYSYCGPGTKFDKRKKQGYKGINNLDQACFKHDTIYSETSDQKKLNKADNELVNAASKIANDINLDEKQRNDAKLVMAIISAKSYLGLGIGDSLKRINKKLKNR